MAKALAATLAAFAAIALAVFAGAEGTGVPVTAVSAAHATQQFIGWSITASVVVIGLLGYYLVRKTFF
jgi:hypothetical protein